jgi:hypothetical protein
VFPVDEVVRELVGGAPLAVAVEEAALVHPVFGGNFSGNEFLNKNIKQTFVIIVRFICYVLDISTHNIWYDSRDFC